MQTSIAAVIVAGCVLYAAWTLMPAGARRGIAARLLAWPLPAPIAAVMRKHATASSACGCDGCDRSPPKSAAPAQVQPIRFHPRPPR